MASEGLPVTRQVVTWARERAGLTLDQARKDFPRIEDWEAGQALPTYPQIEKMADAFKLPVAAFFFPDVPKLPDIKESFRTLSDAEFDQIPRPVRLLLQKAKAFQLNLVELAQGRNPASRLITADLKLSPGITPDEMAERVREYLGITLEQQQSWSGDEAALKHWRDALQSVGIFVFKDAFRAKGFFGFSLYDPVFPVVYVNDTMPKTRQCFTLFHELGHLLFETSGIDEADESYIEELPAQARDIEILCNRFAAHFLVPDAALRAEMRGREPTEATAEYLALRFHVSREVIFRKFLDRRWITRATYLEAAAR
jgi:Zn-dependent peptidase ImmA (M78 family)/transcriptional regulator with XRE-family HTH domain